LTIYAMDGVDLNRATSSGRFVVERPNQPVV
jgi:hypothetical protein